MDQERRDKQAERLRSPARTFKIIVTSSANLRWEAIVRLFLQKGPKPDAKDSLNLQKTTLKSGIKGMVKPPTGAFQILKAMTWRK